VQRDSCDLSQRWQAAASEPTWNSRFGASAPRYNACILSQLLEHAEYNHDFERADRDQADQPRELEAREFLREVRDTGNLLPASGRRPGQPAYFFGTEIVMFRYRITP
jgi:hypothetical protein